MSEKAWSVTDIVDAFIMNRSKAEGARLLKLVQMIGSNPGIQAADIPISLRRGLLTAERVGLIRHEGGWRRTSKPIIVMQSE
ncbi:MAG: hypothetical protein L0Y56_07870 [Nitrospira sp.]|nr:hypothetical protein [Nitrospira sp.]